MFIHHPPTTPSCPVVRSRTRWFSSLHSAYRPQSKSTSWFRLVAITTLASSSVHGQEALQQSLAGQAAAEARQRNWANLPYNFRKGDFRLLTTPSLGLDWNSNIRLSDVDRESDFILRPMLRIGASYPVTAHNLLTLNVGIGYDHYFSNSDLSGLRISSGSEIAFDVFIKDFRIDFHNRFDYTLDGANRSDVADTGLYGGFENTAGVTVDWDLQDLILTLGYDHTIFIASDDTFTSNDRSTDQVVTRAGFKLRPDLTAGAEGSLTFTSYDEDTLNDNFSYSIGAYASWYPSAALEIRPRVGYNAYSFDQTSRYLPAEDQGATYFGLTITHRPTDVISYSVSAGHELRLGSQSDMTEVIYVRPAATWRIIENLDIQTTLFYEHGQQDLVNLANLPTDESYDWYGGSIALGYPIAKRFHASLSYRLAQRSSDVQGATRDYTQHTIGLLLTYRLPRQ